MRFKWIIISVVVLVLAGVGYFVLSPLFNVVEVDDAFPSELASGVSLEASTPSGFENLSPARQAEMLSIMEEVNKEVLSEMADELPVSEESATEELPATPMSSPVMGTFGHPAEGSVRVLETIEGTVIRYEDFKTINGPNLHVYLSKDLGADEFIDLGPIRGTSGNINYTLAADVAIADYRYVMYWCVPFGVLFNYAELPK